MRYFDVLNGYDAVAAGIATGQETGLEHRQQYGGNGYSSIWYHKLYYTNRKYFSECQAFTKSETQNAFFCGIWAFFVVFQTNNLKRWRFWRNFDTRCTKWAMKIFLEKVLKKSIFEDVGLIGGSL